MSAPRLLAERFLAHLRARGFAARTIESYRVHLRVFCDWLDAETTVASLAEVRRDMVQAYQQHLLTVEERDATGRVHPLAASTQLGRLCVLKSLFGWAAREGLCVANPAADLELPKLVRRLPRTLSVDEASHILDAATGTRPIDLRDHALLEVLWATGIRIKELAELELLDLDLTSGELCIRAGKGNKSRLVPLTRTGAHHPPVPADAAARPRHAAHLAPQRRDPAPQSRRRSPRHPGAARPRLARDHPALHPPRPRRPQARRREMPPAGTRARR